MGRLSDLIKTVVPLEDEFTKMVRARDNGEEWAQRKLNELFVNDPNIMPNLMSARRKIYEKDAKNGDPMAMYYYGISCEDEQTFMGMLVPLANNNNIDAITAIGNRFALEERDKEAFSWYMKAAELGDIYSQNYIALQYYVGIEDDGPDYDKAYEWYRKAAQQDSSKGYSGMGSCIDCWRDNKQLDANVSKEMLLDYDMQIVDCYAAALDCAKDDDEFREAAWGLGNAYRASAWDMDIQEKALLMNKAAIFYYYLAYDTGHPYGLELAQEIAEQKSIVVDFNDMERWAQKEGILE